MVLRGYDILIPSAQLFLDLPVWSVKKLPLRLIHFIVIMISRMFSKMDCVVISLDDLGAVVSAGFSFVERRLYRI